jgi:Cys-tRNA(Pro)/Cys-tRNA(Cys) deacylase
MVARDGGAPLGARRSAPAPRCWRASARAADARRPIIGCVSPTPDSTPALDAAAAAGVDHRIVRTESAGSAEEAAQLQGIPLAALLRTIVVRRGEDDYVLVLVPAGRRFDWPKLRAHLGVSRLALPDAEEAREVTGYERYTITPFGSARAWPVVADAAILGEPVVSIGGGARGVNIHVAPADLVATLKADVVDVTQPEPTADC